MFYFKETGIGYLYITQQDYSLIQYIGILQFYDGYYYLITSSLELAVFYEHLATEKSRIHSPLSLVNWTQKSLWIDTCENKISVYPEHSAAGHFQPKVKAGPCSVCWGTACSCAELCWQSHRGSGGMLVQPVRETSRLQALSLQRYLYTLILYPKRIQLISVALHLGWPVQIRLKH